MVRHIVKKDWTLLWPLVTAWSVLEGLLAFARLRGGIFSIGLPTAPAAFLELLAAATVITLVVLQDPVPGVRQDWLIRPVARHDLFLAKLLFVILFVQGPWFVTDLLQGIGNGFPFGQSAAAATACAVSVLLTLSLPVLAFAALTATMTDTFVGALGVFAVVIAFLIVPGLLGATRPAALTGFAWVPSLLQEGLLLIAAVGILVLQYHWRRTWAARGLFTAALVAALCVSLLPWQMTVRLERLLTGSGRGDSTIAIAFAPGVGQLRLTPGQGVDDVHEKPGMGPADVAAENERRRAQNARTVFLPIHVSGLAAHGRLLADRSEVTITDREDHVLFRGPGNDLELRATGTDAAVHQGIRVPGILYGRAKAERLDVELDYWFTLFRPSVTYALPAQGGDQRMPAIGSCATKVDDAGTRVLFQCLRPGERPPCLALVLEDRPTGQRNPEVSLCAPDYTPFAGHTFPDAVSRFGGRLPFYDPSGFVRYPVGGPQLSESRVLVTAFEPTEHFVRRVVIQGIRLQDWGPQVAASVGAPQSGSSLR